MGQSKWAGVDNHVERACHCRVAWLAVHLVRVFSNVSCRSNVDLRASLDTDLVAENVSVDRGEDRYATRRTEVVDVTHSFGVVPDSRAASAFIRSTSPQRIGTMS